MSLYTRSGRARPNRGGLELAIWYLMRLTGVALFVLALAHFSIQHFIFDPSQQSSTWIFNQRWNSLFWRAFDWLLLMTVLLHGFLGVRTVVSDYVKGGNRLVLMTAVYLVSAALFVMGTVVVLSIPQSSLGA